MSLSHPMDQRFAGLVYGKGSQATSVNFWHMAVLAKQERAAASTQGFAGQVVLREPSNADDSSCDTTGLLEVARQHLDIEYCASCNLALQFQGAECVDCELIFCLWCSAIHICENRRGGEDEAKLLCKDPMLAAATASTEGEWARHPPLADGSGDDQRAHRHEHMP